MNQYQKLLKKKFFGNMNFFVNKHVLDPRPETETIIEEVLANIKCIKKKYKILRYWNRFWMFSNFIS